MKRANNKTLNLKSGLIKAVDGLLFMSETDHPFTIVELPSFKSITELREYLKKECKNGSTTKIKTTSLDIFFKNAVADQVWFQKEERENAERFRQLKYILTDNLKEIKVFKMGETEQDVFILGKTIHNTWAGLKTKIVET